MPKPIVRKQKFMDLELVVKKSHIPESGKGLFTKIDIEKEHIITEFSGEKISHTVGAARLIMGQSFSILYLNKKYSIDSSVDKKCLASFINDAKGLIRLPYLRNNASIVLARGRLFVVAKRNIKAGEEIYVSYGKGYWNVIKAHHT